MNYDFDLFVIGAGSGGVRTSRIAAGLGARVAIAEDMFLGGTCVNVGCVPKKLYVYASEFSREFEEAIGFGWQKNERKHDWRRMYENKSQEILRLNGIYKNILSKAGVQLLEGRAHIESPNEVALAGKTYTAERILIATGGWPRKPSFPGAEYVMNSNDMFELKETPKKVLVQGGGYIALEFAGIFKGLTCDTELLYRGEQFLRGFDKSVRNFVEEEVRKKGIKLSFNTDILSIEKLPGAEEEGELLEIKLSNGETRQVNAVMSAIGREPKLAGLGLENTRVSLQANGRIKVNDIFQTDEPSIYALGDVVGRKELTPVALAEGMALARHLYAGEGFELDYQNIATAVFCQPNIACVGLSEEEARGQNMNIDIYESRFRALKNTLSGSDEKTLMKLVVNQDDGKVVGCHMVGEHAGEIIQGIAIAIKAGASKSDFDKTIGIHPTSAEEFVTMREPA